MTVKELEEKTLRAEENINKAINTKSKYEIKLDKLSKEIEDLKASGIDLEDNSYVAYNWSSITSDQYDLHYKYKRTKEAIEDSNLKIKELIKIRDNWKTKLEIAKAKEDEFKSIPQVIKDFVHEWRLKVESWVKEKYSSYLEERKRIYSIYEKITNWNLSKEERNQAKEEYSASYKKLIETTDNIILQMSRQSNKEEWLTKLLDKEEETKILDLVNRVTKITGTIVDASQLSIGYQNGELNGYVIGNEGKCYVETIGAGGYHIQKFHYRVLVKEVK